MATLVVWMNGERVGDWTTSRSGKSVFRYDRDWLNAPHARALSLSLPMTADQQIRGAVVDHYFENLLPDSAAIRRRMSDRFRLRSAEAFELLEAVGRDCAGAVALLPPGDEPVGWSRIAATRLSQEDVEKTLRNVTAPRAPRVATEASDEFRLSMAGAQEKTALLRMGGTWYRPHGATPTTHILKLPLGIVGNFRGDFPHSVENEWLCSRLLRQLRLPVAETEIATFGGQNVLVVERFDRRWIGADPGAHKKKGYEPAKGTWIARLPQEDFCQATGRPPSQRYEVDGGATMNEILELLNASDNAQADRATFILTQLAFWLLAATDGHSKNYSIHLHSGGRFTLTPLYDVLSAWPVIGRGAEQLPIQDAKLAIALTGKHKYYRLQEIQTRRWQDLGMRVGGTPLWERMRALVVSATEAVEAVAAQLPKDFPEKVITSIRAGVAGQCRRFLGTG